MLTIGQFMLNRIQSPRTIHPYIHNFNNKKRLEDVFRGVQLPDVDMETMIEGCAGDFRMMSGDFLEIYSKRVGDFHVVVTCFFLDTSHFVLDYIDVIWKCLKNGGFWVKLGPLQYHYSGVPGEASVELTWEEVVQAIAQRGFILQKQDFVQAHYCQDKEGMKLSLYDCGFFTVKKVC